MSGAQTSTFSNAQSNVLFDPLAVQKAQGVQNQLLQQQQTISAENMAQVGQAAGGLLSAYPDEASRAAAYPRVVGMLQSQGFAKNAPAQYPGEGTLRAIVNASIPAKDLYSSGALLTPAQQQFLNTGTATSTPTTGTPGGGTGAQGQVPPLATAYGQGGPNNTQVPQDWLPYFQEASQRTGIPADVLIAQMRQESGFNPALTGTSGEIGPAQVMPSTARAPGAGVAPVDPSMLRDPRTAINFQADYLKSRLPAGTSPSDPVALNRALYGYNGGGDKDYVAHVTRYLPAPGGGGTPGSYQVASTAPTAPPGSTAAPAAASPAPDTPWDLPGAPAPDLPPPSTPTATPAAPGTAPAQPQQTQPAPAAAPASTSRLPEVSTIPTGRNSAAWQQAQQLIDQGNRLMIVSGSNAGMRAQAQAMIQRGTQQQQLDNMVPAQQDGRPGNLNTTTGQFTPYAPLPSPRFTGGAAVYNKTTGGWDQPTPATQADAVQGHWGVSGSGAPQFFPDATTPAEGGYKNMETAYKRDSEAIGGISQEGRTAQADQVRVQEMRNILKTTNTGSGAETQAAIQAFLQSWAPSMLTNWTTNYANLDGPAAIQMFQKLGFMGATSQEQQVTPRGGYLATKLFQQFNPGAQLLTATNNGLLAQRLIANQASIDYSQGAQNQFAQQEQNFTSSKPSYSSLAQYDRQWQAQRQPQVYAAAIGALGQQDYNQWSKNLSDAEIQRTLDVVHRADPSAVVNGKGGRLDLSQQNAATSAAVTATGPGGHKLVLQNGQWVPQ